MKFIFFIFAIIFLFSCVSTESSERSGGIEVEYTNNTDENTIELNDGDIKTVKITGRVQVYGNEPHTFVGIVDLNEVEYAVYPISKENELRRLQGHLIEFTVVFIDEPKAFGSLFLRGGTVTPIEWKIMP